jgi:hypothetical protein
MSRALLALLTWWLYQEVRCTAEEMGRMFARLTVPAVAASLGIGH